MSESPFEFLPIPPEVMERIRAQQEHMHMHVQDNSHAVKQLLDDLNEDQLEALDFMLANAGSPATVGYFRGLIAMMLQIKFDLCACGERHDTDELIDRENNKRPVEPNTATEHKGKPIEDVELHCAPKVGTEEWHAAVAEYYLVVVNLSNSPGDFELQCRGCEKVYPSLEDRMLRKPGPEGCDRCVHIQKWG